MTLPALATAQDLERRLGRVLEAPFEVSRVEALLDDVSALVRDEAGTDWVDADGALVAVPASIRSVVLRSVERAIRNPDGFSAESDGDYSYQRTGVQDGAYLTDAERAIIRRAIGRTGLWTQPVTRGDAYLNTVWGEDQFGCEPFPLDVYRNC
jgi:hypothetical protein